MAPLPGDRTPKTSPKVPGTNGADARRQNTKDVPKSAWHQWRRCQATEHQRRPQKCQAPMATLPGDRTPKTSPKVPGTNGDVARRQNTKDVSKSARHQWRRPMGTTNGEVESETRLRLLNWRR